MSHSLQAAAAAALLVGQQAVGADNEPRVVRGQVGEGGVGLRNHTWRRWVAGRQSGWLACSDVHSAGAPVAAEQQQHSASHSHALLPTAHQSRRRRCRWHSSSRPQTGHCLSGRRRQRHGTGPGKPGWEAAHARTVMCARRGIELPKVRGRGPKADTQVAHDRGLVKAFVHVARKPSKGRCISNNTRATGIAEQPRKSAWVVAAWLSSPAGRPRARCRPRSGPATNTGGRREEEECQVEWYGQAWASRCRGRQAVRLPPAQPA